MAQLFKEYSKHEDNNANISPQDFEIRTIIQNNASEDFSRILTDEYRWEIFYHLSDMRTSIINWYEFKEGAALLEIGAEFGALTGSLCDRCAHVTAVETDAFKAETIWERYKERENLEIYAAEPEELPFDARFDYITLIGQLGRLSNPSSDRKLVVDYLTKLRKYLKPDGKFLIAVTNRYGIKYFCGATDDQVKDPFDGINKLYRETKGYLFGKKELINILLETGISNYKFYYPLPDHYLTQLIYTDDYLPEKNLQERLIPYYSNSDSIVAYELDLYDDIIDNNVFPFFSNSFFVEACYEGILSSVTYAAISTDRGRNNGFATTIHSDRSVMKKVLFKEGEDTLYQVQENTLYLKNKGIPVLTPELKVNSLVMPYIEGETLSIHLRELIKTDIEQFIKTFDQLYNYILTSSEHVDQDSNALFTEENKELDWGIILKKAFIELIPLNCFYCDSEFLFFDQEFVMDNYPAKYTLFRAIHYVYCFTPNAEQLLQIQTLKSRYGLAELWEIFLSEEARFLKKVRQHTLYKQFYQWASIDRNRMHQNSKRLSYKGENLSEFKPTPHLKKIQEVQMDLLRYLKGICEVNNLSYFMIYGTLLGAVRHGGFIPWDDDVDIVMPREDYNKLISIALNGLKEPYFLQTPENDQECFYGGYSKLRYKSSTGIELFNWNHDCNHGIWIDIFPLDCTYDNLKKNERKAKKIRFYQRLIFAKIYPEEKQFRDIKPFLWKWYCRITKVYDIKKLYIKLNQTMCEGDNLNSSKLGIFAQYSGLRSVIQFDRKDFETVIPMDFEHIKLPAPSGFQNCLVNSYGCEYLRYPAFANRIPHHKAFFAPEVPYSLYVSRFMKIFENTDNKTIVLFGAGLMFDDYMNKRGVKYPPAFIVDNNQTKWGTSKQGIPIQSPQKLLNVSKDKLHLIICNIYFRQIEKQISKMGITDYYIYVQEKEWLTDDPSYR